MTTPDRLITVDETCHLTGLARSSLYERISEGGTSALPRPIKIGPRRSRWSENAILAWIEDQKRASAA
jgi:predicted DNA-binding transcriptional regulator AlpA